MKFPKVAWWGLLVLAVAFVALMGVRDITSANGPDYCALANIRSCKVGDRGEYVIVTTPDGASTLLLVKNGRVVKVLR